MAVPKHPAVLPDGWVSCPFHSGLNDLPPWLLVRYDLKTYPHIEAWAEACMMSCDGSWTKSRGIVDGAINAGLVDPAALRDLCFVAGPGAVELAFKAALEVEGHDLVTIERFLELT